MNLGGFGIGFSDGFKNGVYIGNTIKDAMKQHKIEQVRAQGMEEAKAAQAKGVESMIVDNGIGGAAAPNGSPKAGETVADTPEVQTQAVPTPTVVASPQDAIDQAPRRAAATPSAALPAPAAPANLAAGGIAPASTAPVRKRYSVGEASFDTIEEARSHASKNAPSVTDYFMKNAVPQISQAYLDQGDVAKADAWEKYAKERGNQKHMETWAKMARAAQGGDWEGAANSAFELYKSYDDGVTPLSKETVKDKDGKITGFNVRLKDDSTGEERTQFIGQREIVEMGLAALSPPAMFEQMYKRQQSVDAARIKAAADAADDQRKLQRDITLQGMKDKAAGERIKKKGELDIEKMTLQEAMKEASIGKAEKAKVQAKIDTLKEFGYGDDVIKGMLPQMLGVGEHKKTTDPTERRALVFDTLSKNDPKFARDTPEAQEAKIKQAMDIIYKGDAKPAAPAPAPAGGAPAPAAPQARGVPVLDTKTGKTVLIDPTTGKPIQ